MVEMTEVCERCDKLGKPCELHELKFHYQTNGTITHTFFEDRLECDVFDMHGDHWVIFLTCEEIEKWRKDYHLTVFVVPKVPKKDYKPFGTNMFMSLTSSSGLCLRQDLTITKWDSAN